MTIKGLKEFGDLISGLDDAILYIESRNGERTDGDGFVPSGGNVYPTEEQAKFAGENPKVDNVVKHEMYEFDRRLKR